MRAKVHINLRRVVDSSYDIIIGTPLSDAVKEINRDYPHSSKFVITDSNVGKLYGRKLRSAIKQPARHLLIVPSGEKSKNRKTKELLEDTLIALRVKRNSVIIALGGGVIGDLAGFVAATLLRGVPYIQFPTTLLAQADSSIGGKVAIDHPWGKNLIGAFYQPTKVYIDPSTLRTLSDSEFTNGIAEVIKYAVILDETLFSYIEENNNKIKIRLPQTLHYIIQRCCELKKSVVEKDEKETGLRRVLNFGHTIGHAIESLSNYRISHGQAVAIGMVAEAKMSTTLGMLSGRVLHRLEHLITAHQLPTSIPSSMTMKKIVGATLTDKKSTGQSVHYTLLKQIGKANIDVALSHTEVLRLLKS